MLYDKLVNAAAYRLPGAESNLETLASGQDGVIVLAAFGMGLIISGLQCKDRFIGYGAVLGGAAALYPLAEALLR